MQATLQYSSLRAGPRQFLPLIGSGLLHSLRRSFVPSPQSPSRTSQRDQDDQSDHPPFAEKICYEIFSSFYGHVMYMIILLIALFEIPKLLFDFFLKIVLFSKSQIIQITISRIYGYLPKTLYFTMFLHKYEQSRTFTNKLQEQNWHHS